MEAVPGLRRAVVREYRRVVRPPWEIPTALVTNGALMVAAWFLLPPRAHAFLFSLNGPLAFPVILASWMLADTPATNVMGSSPRFGAVSSERPSCVLAMAGRSVHCDRLPDRGRMRRGGDVCRRGPLSLERDRVGLCARRLSAGRSSSGGRLARHRVPLPSALPALALAAPPSLACPPAVGSACLRALLLRAVDRTRHPEPRCAARSVHQAAWPAAHAGPVRHLSCCRLRNSSRRCRHRSLGRASTPGLADHPPGRPLTSRAPREANQQADPGPNARQASNAIRPRPDCVFGASQVLKVGAHLIEMARRNCLPADCGPRPLTIRMRLFTVARWTFPFDLSGAR
jgi:hypothetical protein